jgi:ER-bound oxygenase mpaB/B'/Rubber oxygenase, catalytic domain
MESPLTNDILDLMRKVGDPLVDTVLLNTGRNYRKRLAKEVRGKGFGWFLEGDRLQDKASTFGIADLLADPGLPPDPDLIKTACDLFARYGSEIAAALLLAALPEAYAAGEGADVLAQHSQLIQSGTLSTRRILATAQFVIWVLTPGTPDPPVSDHMQKYTYPSFDDTCTLWAPSRGRALRASLALRVMHSLIRFSKPTGIRGPALDKWGRVLLNQEDLLATLLSFSITVFEVLEQFGISWTAEEQEAYFYVWDRVGRVLGIGDEQVVSRLTGTGSLGDLTRRLRRFDEGKLPGKSGDRDKGQPRSDQRGAGLPVGSHITSQESDELFKDPLNRQVLRRIAEVGTLRPQSVPEARALLARLRERLWTLRNDSFPQREPFDYENFKKILDDVGPGRILLKALVDEVSAQLPPSQKTWPIAVIRQLVPPQVQNRLALGGTSSIGFLADVVGTPRDSPGSVVLQRLTAAVLRQRATRVADSLFLYYYDQGELEIPGLRSTSLGYGMAGSASSSP